MAEAPPARTPVLSAIVVNFNDRANIGRCLASLLKATRALPAEVIVVDNASTDGSPDVVAAEFPSVRLVRNSENAGFSRANNLAIRQSRGEFLLCLNTDAALSPGTLDGLLEELRRNPRTGIVGPALVNDEGAYQVSFGGRVRFGSELLKKAVLNRVWARRLRSDRARRRVVWVSAACLLARRRAVEDAGGFDERFFLFFEDIDLCYRVGAAGWDVVFLPAVQAFHRSGATTAPGGLRTRLAYRASQL
ncbi:MAG: glycosyltransferase family 2 protein, partial [Candidatus Aminicenantes bacterium]|nr:glycosyltransferase family 2 protein [Candidatus Aminicenantes bacterium]